ncbi:group 3 secretory phospholipase A2 isoform X1 [Betta splendens]|uniref:phospholipase A2 n=1 Tax=Betta splendens TaxID=158456 RepID=A0A6P7NYP1_BETSP|nr:group 3 secretory phospholipase A2 isoform X1 [Betta splendens]
MTHTAPLLTVVLASVLGYASAEASIRCTWTQALPNGEAHYSYLRHDSASVRLYHSAWSEERALLGCSWSDDAAVVRDYVSLCRERTQDFSDQPDGSFNLEPRHVDQCVPLPSPEVSGREGGAGSRPARSVDAPATGEESEVRTRPRVKRAFIVPGTLWCGSGNKAPSYEDLGVFADTDSCCREHDQCKHTILSFHSQFGVFNTNIFTMSHCECDGRFRRCLTEAGDSIAHAVGYTFFNLLKMHCFEFSHRLQCTQRNWFGLCKESKMALYAEVHPPALFDSTGPANGSANSTGSAFSATTEHPTPSDRPFYPTSASTGPSPPPSASITTVTNATTSSIHSSSAPTGPGSERTDTADVLSPAKRLTEQDSDSAARPSACGVYKDLDKCRNKIPPGESRFGLDNAEARTLYHCNCTSRLFQTLSEQTRASSVQALLLGRVSHSCFLLQDCAAGNSCRAVLVRAEFPLMGVEDQRHLQAVRLRVGPKPSRAKRKGRAATLHKLCLRMSRRKMKTGAENGIGDGRKPV